MTKEIEIKVRGYHLDMFSHVNNARYLEFLEEARWAHFEQSGFTIKEFVKRGTSMVVANINIAYKYPAGFGDILQIKTGLGEIRNRSGIIHQTITLKGTQTPVVEAEIVFVFIDLQSGKPVTINDDFRKMFEMLR